MTSTELLLDSLNRIEIIIIFLMGCWLVKISLSFFVDLFGLYIVLWMSAVLIALLITIAIFAIIGIISGCMGH